MRILVIEDNKEIQDVIKAGLAAECFVVDVANDGEAGSYQARINDYDAIILDNMLPKLTGVEVCTDIRDAGKSTPIIVLSAKTEPAEKTALLNAGADDYMGKPFSFEELLARIRAILRRPPHVDDAALRIDDLVLNAKTQTVSRSEKNIHLTRKEFALLEYFMKNPDATLSRAALMHHVWDINADLSSNTLEAHIMTLRKKIDHKG